MHGWWCWLFSIERGGRGVDIGAGECPSSFVGPNGGRLSSLWAVGPVLGHGGQSAFMGGCGGHFLSLVALHCSGLVVNTQNSQGHIIGMDAVIDLFTMNM